MAAIDLTAGLDISDAAKKLKELRDAAKMAVSGVAGDINATEALFDSLADQVFKAKENVKKAQSEISSNQEWIQKLRKQAAEAQEALSAAPTNASRRAVQKEIDAINYALLDEQGALVGNKQKLKEYNEQLTQSQKALKMAQTELKAYQSAQKSAEAVQKAQNNALKETATSYSSIRSQMTAVRNEMADLTRKGQQNSERYKELQNELGQLATAYRKVQFEQKALSTGATQWAGIQSALQGIMGGFAAYQGVLGLVADSSEELVKIQTRLQSVMGIIMGMTQVSNALHATLAARMTTLAKVTDLWNAANLRVGKGLISMGVAANTARIAAIALNGALTMGIGAAIGIIIGWITKQVDKYKEAKKAAEESAKKQREAFESYASSVGQNAGGIIAKFEALKRKYNDLGDSLSAKKKFIKENADAFKELGVKVGDVNDADNLFINNADAFVASVNARARAAATMKVAAEKYEEAFKKMLTAENIKDTQKELEKSGYTKIIQSGGLNILDDKQRDELNKKLEGDKEVGRLYEALSYVPTLEMREDLWDDIYERKEEITKEFLDSVIKDLEIQAKNAEKEASQASVAGYDFNKKAQEALKAAGIVTTDEADAEKKARMDAEQSKAQPDAQRKLAELLISNQFEAEQAQIDMMKEGTEKKLAQIELDYKKREHAINEGEKKLMGALSKTQKTPEQIDAAQQMQSQFKGNVDHLSRPLIAASKLVKKGWEDAGEGIATVFSSQYGILDASGKETEILVTPILPNGDVLSPQELEDYIFGTLEGAQDILKADTKKLVIATDVSTDGLAGDKYHQLQEVYYQNALQIAEKFQAKRDASSFKRQSDRYLAISGGQIDIPDLKTEWEQQEKDWDEYLIKYGTFREKYQAIKDKYDKLIVDAKTEGEKMSFAAERDAELAELEVAMSEWAQGLVDKTLEELTKLTSETKKQLEETQDAFNKLGTSDTPEAKAYLQTINSLKAKIALLESKTKDATKAATDKDWTKGAQLINEISSTAREAASALSEFDEGLGEVATFIATLASAAGNLISTINGVQAASSAAGAAMSSMEKASVILTAISVAFQIMQAVFSLFNKENPVEKTRREFAELNDEIERLKREAAIDSFEGTIFGDNAFANSINNMKLATEAFAQYNQDLENIRNRGKEVVGLGALIDEQGSVSKSSITGLANLYRTQKSWESAAESIANMQVQTRHSTWFRSAKYASLGSLLPNLFDEDGQLNMEALKEFQGSDLYNKISEQNRDLIDGLIEDWDLYEEVLESVRDYLSDIFGDLGNTMTDALVDAFANGTDAAEAFRDSVSDMLQKLAKDMILSTFLTPIFEKAQKQMEGVMGEDLTDEARFAKLADIMGGLTSEALAAQDNIFAALEAFEEAAKKNGLDLFKDADADAQSTSVRGYEAFSQEEGSELLGRATAIQGDVHDIKAFILQITDNGTMLLNEAIDIRDIMIQLNGNVADIRSYTRVLPEMSDTLKSMNRKLDDI